MTAQPLKQLQSLLDQHKDQSSIVLYMNTAMLDLLMTIPGSGFIPESSSVQRRYGRLGTYNGIIVRKSF